MLIRRDNMNENLGEFLYNLRQESGKTIKELKESLGISHQYINDLENNKRVPSNKLLEAIAQTYNLNSERKIKLYDITYEIDGIEYRGLFSFGIITNANRVAGINNFYKDIKLDDNKFEVLLCNITKLKDIIKTLYFFALYDASKIPGFYFYQTDNPSLQSHYYPLFLQC